MNKVVKVLLEAVLVGVGVVILGTIVSYGISMLNPVKLEKVCEGWNKYYVMELSLFLTGFLFHIIFEITGLNRMYCRHYK
jgi:xanthine/uracil permease